MCVNINYYQKGIKTNFIFQLPCEPFSTWEDIWDLLTLTNYIYEIMWWKSIMLQEEFKRKKINRRRNWEIEEFLIKVVCRWRTDDVYSLLYRLMLFWKNNWELTCITSLNIGVVLFTLTSKQRHTEFCFPYYLLLFYYYYYFLNFV